MRHDARAVLFDLDDTLYPLRRFVASGFGAVAAHLEATRQLDADAVLNVLEQASADGFAGRELQACARRFALPGEVVPELVEVIRRHEPRLRLPRESLSALQALRPGWKLGVVTNGFPDIQARKAAALGLPALVDAIVYASEHGAGGGKPDREPFDEALRRLGVPADRAVFVGDDELCDVYGAGLLGMRTVFLAGPGPRGFRRRSCYADETVQSLIEVPDVAGRLVDVERPRHVA